jgi:hypothetical protein
VAGLNIQKLDALGLKLYLPIAGGNRNNGAKAGLSALNLNNARSNSNSNIGFRPALLFRQMLCGYGRIAGTLREKGALVPP